jgi:hypothetical protein
LHGKIDRLGHHATLGRGKVEWLLSLHLSQIGESVVV